MRLPVIAACTAALALASCVTEDKYAASVEALKGSPQLRQKWIADCTERNRKMPIEQKRMIGEWMGIPADKVMPIFCSRIITAMSEGKLSHSEFRDAAAGRGSKRVADVLKGRV
jgi:hypothetical protein